MKAKALATILTLSTLILTATAAAKPKVEFSPAAGAIDVLIDGKPFTSYMHQIDPARPMAAEGVLLTKPVLYPLSTPSGITVTRGWPFEKIEGEKTDHPHHIGLYFTYDEINDNDFWNNSKEPLPAIKHASAEVTTDAKGNPALATTMIWIGKGNKPLLLEKRITSFIPGPKQHIIDIDIEFEAVADKVEFGDTKEGMFAIRLAQWLTENTDSRYELGTGAYLSCNGDEKQEGVWTANEPSGSESRATKTARQSASRSSTIPTARTTQPTGTPGATAHFQPTPWASTPSRSFTKSTTRNPSASSSTRAKKHPSSFA